MEEGKDKRRTDSTSLPGSFTVGAIALVFLIIGYQAAVFIHHAATVRLAANRDRPDTVYVIDSALARRLFREEMPGQAGHDAAVIAGNDRQSGIVVRRNSQHNAVAKAAVPRRVESFRFNPNTVSLEDLQRLGFSEKQAQAIDNYRQKGGRFRRPGDFARSYVVSDSVFARLEKYIDIPKLDLNKADSTALLDLPGIGPWFAGRIVSYRESLCGFSSIEQLLDIKNFSQERLDGFRDLVTLSKPEPYPLWSLPEEELRKHPYISSAEAHGIVLYRDHHKKEALSVDGLLKAGVISESHAEKLGRCAIGNP
jgi:DNA uptake protein ComE-like DNA-binding protein